MLSKRLLILMWCLGILWGCASQDDVLMLDSRIVNLREEHEMLKKRVAEVEQTNLEALENSREVRSQMASYREQRRDTDQQIRTQAAGIRVMMNELREQENILRGQIEETEFMLKQKMEMLIEKHKQIAARLERLEEAGEKLQKSVSRIEQYLNLEPADTEKPSPDTLIITEAQDEELSEKGLYQKAKAAFDRDDFETALNGFQKFIERFPKSKNADNAQFWIGEIYYREKWYEKAILEYQKVIENYPKGNKVQAALLKQGFAFYRLDDKTNGRLILKELVRKYPDSSEAALARRKIAEWQ